MKKPALRTLLAAALLPLSGCASIASAVGLGGPAANVDPGVLGARPVGYVYSTLYAKNAVLEINAVQSRVDSDPIIVPNGPRSLAMDPRDRNLYLYVVCELGNAVAVVDRRSRQVIRTISVGNSPYDMAITPNGTRGFVTNSADDTVSVIDITSNTVIQVIALSNPVTNTGAGTAVATNPTGQPVVQTKLNPKGIATNADGTFVYVACAGGILAILQGTPGTAAASAMQGTGTTPVVQSTYSRQRLVQLPGSVSPLNVAVASTASAAASTGATGETGVTAGTGSGATDTVYVTDPQANAVFLMAGAQAAQATLSQVPGSPYGISVGTNAAGTQDSVYVSLESRDALQTFAPNMSPKGEPVRLEGRQPQAVMASSLGNEIYVSLPGSNNVAVLNRGTQGLNTPQVFNLQQLNPQFIAPTGDIALGGFLTR